MKKEVGRDREIQDVIAGPIGDYPRGSLPSEVSHQAAHDQRR